jgi:hypothetical protein
MVKKNVTAEENDDLIHVMPTNKLTVLTMSTDPPAQFQ